jgi:hypothetical protein
MAATALYAMTMLVCLIKLSVLMFCGSILWCFLPKKTDDPLIRLVKTTGIAGGIFIALIMILLIK